VTVWLRHAVSPEYSGARIATRVNPTSLGLACAFATSAAWGAADYLAAHVTRRIGETRTLLGIQGAGLPPLLIAWAMVAPPRPNPASLAWITLAAAAFGVGYLSFFYGLRVGAVSLVSPISSAGALIPVSAGIVLFGEEISASRLGGIALTLTGLAIMLIDPRAVHDLGSVGRRRGILAGVATMLAWGSGTALLLPLVKEMGSFAPIALLRVEILLVMFAWFAWRGAIPRTESSSPRWPPALWAFIVPAAVLDLAAFFSYGFALHTVPASVAAPIASAYPLVTIVIARHMLHERLSRKEWGGVAVTLAGTAALGFG